MLRRVVAQASAHYRRRATATSSSPEVCFSFRQFSASTSHSTSVDRLDDSAASSPSSAKISIDRSGLYNPPEHSHSPCSDSELVKHLKGIIKFRGGPITVAEYMEEVLTNPKAGFYINRDVFGAQGDFITSPEVSQMFGEMIGVWVMCSWEQMGRPKNVNLIELGPGRGTLLADLLRGASKFKNFTDSLHIHLVECSPALRKVQYKSLKCESVDGGDKGGEKQTVRTTMTGSPVSWHSTLEEVPTGLPTIIIAHEFYDALPIHQFQRASHGWYEKMVDVAENSSFQFVLSPRPTPATLYLLKRCKWAETEGISKLDQIEICPKAMDLTRTIARRIGSDGGAALIIDYGLNGIVSDSLQAIRKHKFVNILDDPGSADISAYVDFAAVRHSAEEVSVFWVLGLGTEKYAPMEKVKSSFLNADTLKTLCAENIGVHGPISQSQFLGSLGINFRVEALLEKCTDEQAESLRTGYWRLVGEGEAPFWEGPDEEAPIGMGTRYLAMAIVNKNQGIPVPFH